jgi:hypothetical protein
MKFIPTPIATLHTIYPTPSFDSNVTCISATFFAPEGKVTAEEIRMENDNRPKLYIKKEEWWPPPQYIPDEIHDRIINFRKALAQHFVKRRGKPNLLPSQCKILRQIWRDDNIVIVNADKGLGHLLSCTNSM